MKNFSNLKKETLYTKMFIISNEIKFILTSTPWADHWQKTDDWQKTFKETRMSFRRATKKKSTSQVKVSLAVMLSHLVYSCGLWITAEDTFSVTSYQQKVRRTKSTDQICQLLQGKGLYETTTSAGVCIVLRLPKAWWTLQCCWANHLWANNDTSEVSFH